jgi:hypothetical protein
VAYEDRFFVIGIGESESLAPHTDTADALIALISSHLRNVPSAEVVFDLRGLREIYNDVHDFLYSVSQQLDPLHCSALLQPDDLEVAAGLKFAPWITKTIKAAGPAFGWHPYDLSNVRHFVDDTTLEIGHDIGPLRDSAYMLALLEKVPDSKDRVSRARDQVEKVLGASVGADEMSRILDISREYAAAIDPLEEVSLLDELESCLLNVEFNILARELHRHSLLVEFTLQASSNDIGVVPYHASAAYELSHPHRDDVLVGRPSVFASRTSAVFSHEIGSFEALLSRKGIKEREIQTFLEAHPHFLQGLNYTRIHPQIVLEREDGSSLRPDFLLEPTAGEWCDILDIKLPAAGIIVGRRDRLTLAAGIHEVAAQLREYAAYFENPKYRKYLLDRFGLRAYKPRLIAIVGRAEDHCGPDTSVQVRRALTCYADVEVMSFDRLIEISRRRLLI